MKISSVVATMFLTGAAMVMFNSAFAADRTTGRDAPGAPVVYVESQGLFYDSIALTNLPMKGDFQQLVPGTNGLATAYGPGDVGYLGGRWWIDLNADNSMDEGDLYFLCPLLGPGRTTL